MSDEDVKKEATANSGSAKANDANADYYPTKKKGKRLLIVLAVLAVIGVGAGIGGWIWHEQPSFCNAICHVPMDAFYETFMEESGVAGLDKWGNAVEEPASMLAVTHRESGEDCLACHVPTIGEMVSEGLAWIPGNYYFPLYERTVEDLTEARKIENDQFCLNKDCHHVTADGKAIESRQDLISATASYGKRNPHVDMHSRSECSDCHKAHRASVNACSECHNDAPIPKGWLTTTLQKALENPWGWGD